MKDKLKLLRRIQKETSYKIILQDGFKEPISLISGIDMAFLKDKAIIACITLDFSSLNIINKKCLVVKLNFPYIPTFLGFREGPAIIDVINSINVESNIFIINAHGLAHPLYCGCASYVGVLVNKSTIGVATNNLCGEYNYEPIKVGESIPMFINDKIVGWVLKSKENCKPIFISPGHLVSLDSSLKIIKKCIKNHKLPEPLYYAHALAKEKLQEA